MTVLITGGTGFVGSHVCRQLMARGHAVRLLVRNPEKAKSYYKSLEETIPELSKGDISDRASVESAIEGCEAVVHAAAATPMQIDSVEKLFAVNVGGTRNVVDCAINAGVRHIVCLSSITAIFNTEGNKVNADAEPVPSRMPYGQSKVETEYYLRQLQSQGQPIAIVYPGGIIGPEDPGTSDALKALQYRIKNGFRIFGEGGMQHVDVRDLATFICILLEKEERGRFLIPGVYVKWRALADIVEKAYGLPLKRIEAQGWKLRLIGRLVDLVRLFKKVDTPVSAETMRYATLWPNIANAPEILENGITLRPVEETFSDTIDWAKKHDLFS
ncbi:MAG: SDR family NAD(P)-dependent oxidoreductase [Pseudomonadales bacterium]|nr:SDR family NAD(P)-dependent oxidoreductase [Pseudomonadales bacterium]